MFCKFCGKRQGKNYAVCKYCGNPLTELQDFGNTGFTLRKMPSNGGDEASGLTKEDVERIVEERLGLIIKHPSPPPPVEKIVKRLSLLWVILMTVGMTYLLLDSRGASEVEDVKEPEYLHELLEEISSHPDTILDIQEQNEDEEPGYQGVYLTDSHEDNRHEGEGFNTPEEALIAFLQLQGDSNLERSEMVSRMISTFAIESYVEGQRVEANPLYDADMGEYMYDGGASAYYSEGGFDMSMDDRRANDYHNEDGHDTAIDEYEAISDREAIVEGTVRGYLNFSQNFFHNPQDIRGITMIDYQDWDDTNVISVALLFYSENEFNVDVRHVLVADIKKFDERWLILTLGGRLGMEWGIYEDQHGISRLLELQERGTAEIRGWQL